MATDAGRVYRVGVGLPGGIEPAAFLATGPVELPGSDERPPAPARVAMAAGGSVAVIEGGALHLMRARLGAETGLSFKPAMQPIPVGQSLGAASGTGAIFSLTRSREGQAAKLTSFDPIHGGKLWDRQIGLGILARRDASDRLTWFDSEARLLELDESNAAAAVLARPPTVRPISLQGWPADAQPTSALWRGDELIALASSPSGWRLIHGTVKDGAIAAKIVNLPFAPESGLTEPVGTIVYLALNDKAIHRIDLATGQSLPGPTWEGRVPAVFGVSDVRCVVVAEGRMTLWGWSVENETAEKLRTISLSSETSRLELGRWGEEVFLFGTDSQGAVFGWDLRKFAATAKLPGDGIKRLLPLTGDRKLLLFGENGSEVVDVGTGTITESPWPKGKSLAFVEASRSRAVVVGIDGRVWAGDGTSWKEASTKIPSEMLARLASVTPFPTGIIVESTDGTLTWLEPVTAR